MHISNNINTQKQQICYKDKRKYMENKQIYGFLSLDMLWWGALGPWGGCDERREVGWGGQQGGQWIVWRVGPIEMQDPTHLQQSSVLEREEK